MFLNKSELNYAQIEKELLVIVFSFEKFHNFVYGREVIVQTDHKPLISIIKKDLNKVSARLQQMLLKLLKYDIDILYIPGRDMFVADTLSRSFIKDDNVEDLAMNSMIHNLKNDIPMTDKKKEEFINVVFFLQI